MPERQPERQPERHNGLDHPGDPGPVYQGRRLPRPDEELVDQGLGFDIGTLVGRRQLLRVFGLGAGALGLAACGATATTGNSTSTGKSTTTATSASSTSSGTGSADGTTEIPDETAGPYPGDGSNGPDVLAESGVVRQDIRSSFGTSTTTAAGIPTTIRLNIKDLANGGSGFAGVAVYAWHCDQEGRYSMYSSGVENENYLRGVQIADSSGTVEFTSIFPACYSGRWPHIHFEVYPDQASITDVSNAIATSQIALPKDACDAVYATDGYSQSVTNLSRLSLATDGIFGDDSGALQLATVTGSVGSGYTVELTAGIDTATEPTGGSMGGGPGGPPPGN